MREGREEQDILGSLLCLGLLLRPSKELHKDDVNQDGTRRGRAHRQEAGRRFRARRRPASGRTRSGTFQTKGSAPAAPLGTRASPP